METNQLPKGGKKIIAIPGYHKIGDPPLGGWETWCYVSGNVFEKQLNYLKNNDWQVISFETFLEGLANPALFPDKSALITFDDGYRSNLEIAYPILKRFGYPAVMFVPTAFVGSYNSFDADIGYEPIEAMCSWEELRELDKLGFSIQSHGVNHSHFSELTVEQLKQEVVVSKEMLEQELNKTIEAFSFPYGDNGLNQEKTDGILKDAGYTAAFLFNGDPIDTLIPNPFRIQRVAIGADTNLVKELSIIDLPVKKM